MAKLIEYDVTGEEESTGGTGVKIRPGVHPARIVRCVQRTEKRNGEPANDLEVALDVGEEYDWVFTYIGLTDASRWKLAEFIRALGLKDKGKLNPEKIENDKPIVRVKINHGTYGEDYSPNAGRLMKAQPGDEDLIGSQVSETSSRNGDGPVDDTAASDQMVWREGQPDPENPAETVGSYDDWTDEDLTGEVSDRGLTLPGGRGAKRVKCITALRADDEAAEESATAVAEGAADGADDYDDWDLDKLKTEWNDRNLGDLPEIKGRGAADRLKAAIVEELRKDDVENPFQG